MLPVLRRLVVALFAVLLVSSASRSAWAEEDAGAGPELPWQPGPAKIELGHGLDLTLDLPEHDLFLPPADAARLLEKDGNLHNENLLGLVAPMTDGDRWCVTLRYEPEGFVADDDKLDADDMLKSLRETNEEVNEEKKSKGFLPLFLDGWSDPPRYDKGPHHLVWGVKVSVGAHHSINYNTRVLGRRGWVAVNLIADVDVLERVKPEGRKVLDATRFKEGARYQDFDKKTDKVAEYGLVGLVLGGAGLGAAKIVKIGLLAKFWKVIVTAILVGKKAILVGVAAVAAFVKRFFGKKKET